MSQQRLPLIITISFIIIVFVVTCGLLGWFTYNTILLKERDGDPKQIALKDTDILLSAVKSHPNGQMPHDSSDLPSYLWVNEDCWEFIQEVMKQNNNNYSLEVVSYDDSRKDPYPVHDLIEIFVQVKFPNNRRAEMLFAQGTLKGCREIK